MKLNNPSDTKAITAFIAEELSWKKLYYDKFSRKQKSMCIALVGLGILFWASFFACLILFTLYLNGQGASGLLLPIVIAFIAIVAFICIFRVLRMIRNYEKEVFTQHYRTSVCTEISQVKLSLFTNFIGEYNTVENRQIWLQYFTKKSKRPFYSWIAPICLIVVLGFAAICLPFFTHLHRASIGFLTLFIVSFLFPGTRFRKSPQLYKEAKELVSRLADWKVLVEQDTGRQCKA